MKKTHTQKGKKKKTLCTHNYDAMWEREREKRGTHGEVQVSSFNGINIWKNVLKIRLPFSRKNREKKKTKFN